MSMYLKHYLDIQKNEYPCQKLPSLEQIKQHYIRYLLDVTQNDLEETAEILDVSSTFLKKRLKK